MNWGLSKKNNISVILFILVLVIGCVFISSCNYSHTSTQPSSKSSRPAQTVCDKEGHKWENATCTRPKTCSVCGITNGVSLGHDFVDNICTRCGDYDKPVYIVEKNQTRSGDYSIFSGSVENFSTRSVEFVKIKLELMDEDKKILDTDWTYAVGSEGLRPGAQARWELMYNDAGFDWKYWRVSVMDYD